MCQWLHPNILKWSAFRSCNAAQRPHLKKIGTGSVEVPWMRNKSRCLINVYKPNSSFSWDIGRMALPFKYILPMSQQNEASGLYTFLRHLDPLLVTHPGYLDWSCSIIFAMEPLGICTAEVYVCTWINMNTSLNILCYLSYGCLCIKNNMKIEWWYEQSCFHPKSMYYQFFLSWTICKCSRGDSSNIE